MRLFPYYGSKNKAAKKYPAPIFDKIIEPFAGAAGYSCLYHDRDVFLYDKNPIIVGVIRFLIDASKSDILGLPIIAPGESVDDYNLTLEQKHLIGFWLNNGTTSPCKRLSSWGRSLWPDLPVCFWGSKCRERLSNDVMLIKHWKVFLSDYVDIGNERATWFIDPPYINDGLHYKKSSSAINYSVLADFCKSRDGHVIVCENGDAAWLPFVPVYSVTGSGRGRNKKVETLWTNVENENDD